MFAANTYLFRLATEQDAVTIARLAEGQSQPPLSGRVLIGQIDGRTAAAISLDDGRTVADQSGAAWHVLACLRIRAHALRTYEATPSLRMRLLAGVGADNQRGPARARGGTSAENGRRPASRHRARQRQVRQARASVAK